MYRLGLYDWFWLVVDLYWLVVAFFSFGGASVLSLEVNSEIKNKVQSLLSNEFCCHSNKRGSML